MPHKSLYITNEKIWNDVKKLAFRKNKKLSGYIEEILLREISEEKRKTYTPQKVAEMVRRNFDDGSIISKRAIIACLNEELFVSNRQLNTWAKDLVINHVLDPIDGKKDFYEVRGKS